MKQNIKYKLLTVLAGISLAACSPDELTLGTQDIIASDLVQGIAFEVVPDAANPNLIHLNSLMPSRYSVVWEHPQGRDVATSCDLKIPFAGDYEIKFGVSTRGGYVWSEVYQFHVEDMCADFISDPLWTLLTGGGGNSKTWYVDIDENGTVLPPYGSPTWYMEGYNWNSLHSADGLSLLDDDWDAENALEAPADGAWYWLPDSWDSWMCEAKTYEMTFDLIGGANVTYTVDGIETKGVFNMDVDKHTMSTSGIDWPILGSEKNFTILILTDDYMSIQPITGNSTTINFISKAYRDSYQATPEQATLPDGWYNVFVNQNLYGSWALSDEDSFDLFTLTGERRYMNGNFTVNDIAEISLNLDEPSNGLYEAKDINGEKISGSYTISEEGILYLSEGIGNSLIASPEITLSVSNANTLKVLDVQFDELGRISDIWFGKELRDFNSTAIQYVGYHYVAVLGGSDAPKFKVEFDMCDSGWAWYNADPLYITSEGTYTMTGAPGLVDPYVMFLDVYKILDTYPECDIYINEFKVNGSKIDVDDNDFYRQTGDDASTARRSILNPWGDQDVFNRHAALFTTTSDGSVEVTFTIRFNTGQPFIEVEEAE